MNKRIAIVAIAAAFIAAPSATMAQSVSGEVGIHSNYLDDDLFVYTNEPNVQAAVFYDFSDHCSLDVWGTHGLATSTGSEIDVGASCRISLAKDTEVEVIAYRDFLTGDDDMTEVSVGVTHGPVNVTVTQFIWDNNPDATRVVASYTLEPSEKLSLKPMLAYETGFGEADILAGGLKATYALSDQFSLVGQVLTPIKKDGADERTTEVSVGIKFTF